MRVLCSVIALLLCMRAVTAQEFQESFPPTLGLKAGVQCHNAVGSASEPSFTFSLINQGSARIIVPTIVLTRILFVTIRAADGTVQMHAKQVEHRPRGLRDTTILEPAKSMLLSDWVDLYKPTVKEIPLSYFGYSVRDGQYTISVAFSNGPNAEQLGKCDFAVGAKT